MRRLERSLSYRPQRADHAPMPMGALSRCLSEFLSVTGTVMQVPGSYFRTLGSSAWKGVL